MNYDITSILYDDTFREYSSDYNIKCDYIDIDSLFNKFKNTNEQLFKIFSINIQSLNSKIQQLRNLIETASLEGVGPSVIAVQETWLSQDSNTDSLSLINYNFISTPRPEGRGGGVGLFIHSKYQTKVLFPNFFVPHIFETMCVKVTLGSFKALIVNVYRPPHRNPEDLESFFNILGDFLDVIDDSNLPVFIVGDYNLNLFTTYDVLGPASRFFNLMVSNGYLSLTLRATRVHNFSYSLIDSIFCKDFLDNFVDSHVIVTDLSDHFVLSSSFSHIIPKPPKKPQYFEKRFLEEANIDNLNYELSIQNWDEVLSTEDVDLAYAKFFSIFFNLYNSCCPKDKIRNNRRTMPQSPWMSNHLLLCNRFRDKLYRKSLSYPTEENKDRYSTYRNNYQRTCRERKRIYYQSELEKAGKDGRKVWQVLREVMGKSKYSSDLEYLEINGAKIENKKEIANAFNSHFAKLGENLTPEIPQTSKDFRDYLPPPINDSIFIPPLDELQVFNIITSCRPKTAKDVNDVSCKLLIQCAANLVRPLTHIYNLSFSQGIFPSGMKVSKNVVVYKSGPLTSLDSWRGVSIINTFSKPLERIMYKSLYEFLDERSFFSTRQFGFRPGLSTAHNVLDLVNRITAALSEKKVCAGILIDIKKCFDLVDRNILLKKLEHYGCRGVVLRWFESYFEGRSQQVAFGGEFSDVLSILIGVLQGSTLGVLLFLIVVNDLDSATRDALLSLFADDTFCLLTADNIRDLFIKIENTLPQITEWYNSNKLIINSKKTKVILFQSPRQNFTEEEKNLIKQFPVFINSNHEGENLPEKIQKLDHITFSNSNPGEQAARHLGIQIDEKLSFKVHFNLMHKRILKIVYSLRQMRHILDSQHLKLLYFAYIKSVLNYCLIVFTAVPNILLEPILKLQKECCRLIAKKPRRFPSNILFKQLEILPIRKQMEYEVFLFMYKYKNNMQPRVFDGVWNTRDTIHDYETRFRNNFIVDQANRNFIFNSPLHFFPRLWNTLPENLKTIPTFLEFKRKAFYFVLNSI